MFEIANVFLWMVVGFQGLCICYLIRELSEVRSRAQSGAAVTFDGLPAGSPAPEFTGLNVQTGELTASSAFKGQRAVLLFLTSECSDCRRIATQLSRLSPTALAGLIVYCYGTSGRCQNLMSRLRGMVPAIRDDQANITEAYRLRGFPSMVALDRDWNISSYRYPHQATDVQEFLRVTLQSSTPSEPAGLDLATPAEGFAGR